MNKNYTSPALKLARLKAKAAGDSTGGTNPSAQNSPIISQLLQQNAQPLQVPVQQPSQFVPPSDQALMGAYQNALASKVAELNQNAALANKKTALANYETTRKEQAKTLQSKIEDSLVDPNNNAIPSGAKVVLGDIFGVTGNAPAATQRQAIDRLTALSDKDVAATGWTRDQLNHVANTYYKPGTMVNPKTSIADLQAAPINNFLPSGGGDSALVPGQTLLPAQPQQNNFSRGLSTIGNDFVRGAGVIGNSIAPALQDTNTKGAVSLGDIGKGAQKVGSILAKPFKYAFGNK